MRHLLLSLALLCLAPWVRPQGAEARFKALVGEALALPEPGPSEGARLHRTFLDLETLPDGAFSMATLHQAARAGLSDPTLRATVTAIQLLTLAAEGQSTAYSQGFARFRASGAPEALLRQADARSATVPCPTCEGRRWVCPACRGIVLCVACGGRGNGFKRAEGFALTEAKRIPCATCGGSGLCRACRGARKVCPTCRDAGTVIAPECLYERISRLAVAAARQTLRDVNRDAEALTMTRSVAPALRLCRTAPTPEGALTHLRALEPKTLALAVQRERIPALIAAAEAWAAEAAAEATPPPPTPKPPAKVAPPPAPQVSPSPPEPVEESAPPKTNVAVRVTPPPAPKPSQPAVEPPPLPPAKPLPPPVEPTAAVPWGWIAAGVGAFLALYVLGTVLLTARRSR